MFPRPGSVSPSFPKWLRSWLLESKKSRGGSHPGHLTSAWEVGVNPGSVVSLHGIIGTNVIHCARFPKTSVAYDKHEERESKLTAEHPVAMRGCGASINLSHKFQVDSVPMSEVLAMSEATRTWAVTSATMSLHEPNISRDMASNTLDQLQRHSYTWGLFCSTDKTSQWGL